MAIKTTIVFLLCIANLLKLSSQVEYMVNPAKQAKEEEFDGISVALLKGATYCDRTTQFGDRLKVYYNASLTDGTEVESNFGKQKPFEFVLGEGQVIQGWEYGLQDMCAGEIRHLSVPAKYAYGDLALGAKFPARVTLHFTVQLLGFERIDGAPRKSNVFMKIDKNKDGLLSKEEVTTYLRNEGIQDRPGEEGLHSLLTDIFVEEDRDKDGLITFSEFSGQKHDEL